MKIKSSLYFLLVMLLMFSTKLFFFLHEPGFRASFLSYFEIITLFVAIVLFIYFGFKEKSEEQTKVNKSSHLGMVLSVILSVFILAALAFSFYLSAHKGSIDWDSTALYDMRAKFLRAGLSFSDMVPLNKYDIKNQYYYLLYPPFTSILHYFWYNFFSSGITIIYSIFLSLFTAGLFIVTKKRLGILGSLFLIFVVVSTKIVISSSFAEYTNLPYWLFLTIGVFLLASYLKTRRMSEIIAGAFFIATSQWVRYLEPVWLVILVAFLVSVLIFRRFKENTKALLILFFLGFLEFFIWRHFLNDVAHNPQITQVSWIFYGDLLLGVFTGSIVQVSSVFFATFGTHMLIYLTALLPFRIDFKEDIDLFFLKLVILFGLIFYLIGLYGVAVQFDWWKELNGSIERSSGFLIPIGVYLILVDAKRFLAYFNKRENGKTLK